MVGHGTIRRQPANITRIHGLSHALPSKPVLLYHFRSPLSLRSSLLCSAPWSYYHQALVLTAIFRDQLTNSFGPMMTEHRPRNSLSCSGLREEFGVFNDKLSGGGTRHMRTAGENIWGRVPRWKRRGLSSGGRELTPTRVTTERIRSSVDKTGSYLPACRKGVRGSGLALRGDISATP